MNNKLEKPIQGILNKDIYTELLEEQIICCGGVFLPDLRQRRIEVIEQAIERHTKAGKKVKKDWNDELHWLKKVKNKY